MRWSFLVITSNYKKYVEYFTQQYKNVKVTKDRAKFEDAHTCIEVWRDQDLSNLRGFRFDFVFTEDEIIRKRGWRTIADYASTNIVQDIETLDSKMSVINSFQPRIVKCKECEYWEKETTEECGNIDSACFHNGYCQPDWFCPVGKRKIT